MSTQDPMTDEVVRELHHRADALYDAPLTLDDVRDRARGIRRRRRVAAAASVAAAVAIAVVVPTILAASPDRADGPQPAPPPPSQSAHTAVLHDGEVTLPDGSTVEVDLDNRDVTQLGLLTDGRIVAAMSRPYAVRVYAADGTLDAEYPVQSNAIRMSPTDDLVAWVDDTFRVQVLESGAAEPVELRGIPMPGESVGSIDAVLGSDCAHGGCRILGGDYTTTTTESSQDSSTELTTSEPLRITDVSPDGGTWAVVFPPAEGRQYGCVGLYEPAADEVTARSCNASALEFSPDGRHLLSGYYENNMAGSVSVLDRELRVVRDIDPGRRVISRAAWSDANHVLAVVAGLDDNRWSLVRYSLDGGDPETVAGPVAGRNPEILTEYLPSE
jgi:hypothetical protein